MSHDDDLFIQENAEISEPKVLISVFIFDLNVHTTLLLHEVATPFKM